MPQVRSSEGEIQRASIKKLPIRYMRRIVQTTIHMEIIALAGKIGELAKEGVEINLDPPCVKVFNNAINEAWTIKQRSKAEIAGHMNKGKW